MKQLLSKVAPRNIPADNLFCVLVIVGFLAYWVAH
jgi:hypothetical protein